MHLDEHGVVVLGGFNEMGARRIGSARGIVADVKHAVGGAGRAVEKRLGWRGVRTVPMPVDDRRSGRITTPGENQSVDVGGEGDGDAAEDEEQDDEAEESTWMECLLGRRLESNRGIAGGH